MPLFNSRESACRAAPLAGTFALALFLGIASASTSEACPFCAKLGKTLSETVEESAWCAYGALSQSKLTPGGDPPESTLMEVRTLLKSAPRLAGKSNVTLAKYFPRADKKSANYLIFAEIVGDSVEPFRAIPTDAEAFIAYLAQAVTKSRESRAERLGYFFRYLDDPDPTVAEDAYKEFAKAAIAEVIAARSAYDRQRIARWITDPNTPAYRLGLFGLLLGICGTDEDAELLHARCSDPKLRPHDGIDGMMAGLSLLRPKQGVDYILSVLHDAGAGFKMRYSALQAVRFCLANAGRVDHGDFINGLAAALRIPELADLVIDELRKQKAWDRAEAILGLGKTTGFDTPSIERAILRFAVQCPDPRARGLLAQAKQSTPQLVAEVEESLRFEKDIMERFERK